MFSAFRFNIHRYLALMNDDACLTLQDKSQCYIRFSTPACAEKVLGKLQELDYEAAYAKSDFIAHPKGHSTSSCVLSSGGVHLQYLTILNIRLSRI